MSNRILIPLDSIEVEVADPDKPLWDQQIGPSSWEITPTGKRLSENDLDRVLRDLSDTERAIIESRVIKGESLRTCAERIGLSHQTVRIRERLIRRKLKDAFLKRLS